MANENKKYLFGFKDENFAFFEFALHLQRSPIIGKG